MGEKKVAQKAVERLDLVVDVQVRTIIENANDGDLGSVRDSIRTVNRAVIAVQALGGRPGAEPFNNNRSLDTFMAVLNPLVELRMSEEVKARVLKEFEERKFL